jgi:nucleotide-binding universal stress UspA family protein
MKEINIIVCGTNFSVHAQEAADAAAALAKRFSATLVLVHVQQEGVESAGTREKLANEAARLRASGAEVEEHFVSGSPATGLVQTVNERKADLLVVSTIGQIAPSRFVTESVAERAAETSPVPTLVVRRSTPLVSWANGKGSLRTFVAYDFSAAADRAVKWLRPWQQIGRCDISVAYAAYPPQESWRLGIGENVWMPALPSPAQRIIQSDIEERVGETLDANATKVRVETTWGRADPVLLALAKEAEADLIVLGTHQRHGFGRFWLGSVSRAMLRDTATNVVVVPQDSTAREEKVELPTIRRVLVTTDFSDLGNRAIPRALALLPCGGTLCLVHVVTNSGSDHSEQCQVGSPDHPANAQLRALVPQEAEACDVAIRTEVIESGKTSASICQAAERFDADVICIASHGRSGISKAILGSVAQDVMARSTRPVLVVR